MSGLPLNGSITDPMQTFVSAASVILDGADGILFTGSSSTIEPFHRSGPASVSGLAHDSARTSPALLTHVDVETSLCARVWQWQSVPSDADASNNA